MDYKSNPYDVSTYVNPNDTYTPSEEVKQGTEISSGDFQKSRDYYTDGATVPILLFCFGFLALVVFNLCLCCGIAKLCATKHKITDHALSCGEYCNRIVFGSFIIICFLATHILYVGYSDVVDGFDIMRSSTTQIAGGFDEMNMHIASLATKADSLKSKCDNYGCSDEAADVEQGVGYMNDDLGKIPDYTEDINSGIDMAEEYVTLLMFVMYGCLMISILVYIFTELCCKAKACGAICCGNIAFVIVAFIGILWMVLTSVTADYCYENPTVNTISVLPANKGQMYVVWYSSCHSGFNPVDRYINYTHAANQEVNEQVGNDNSQDAQDIKADTAAIHSLLNNLTVSTIESCPPVQTGWLSLLNEGVCTSFYEGVRVIWICEVAACISLFFLMVIGAIIGRTAKEDSKIVPDADDQPLHHDSHQQGKSLPEGEDDPEGGPDNFDDN